MGAQSTYTQAVADAICERLAAGESLRSICKTDGMPHEATVRSWALDDVSGFGTQYTRAREIGYLMLAEEIVEISDDSKGDTIVLEDGREVADQERIARSRLRVDTRKWLLSKMLPKVYGDKLGLTDGDGKPLQAAAPIFNVTLKG